MSILNLEGHLKALAFFIMLTILFGCQSPTEKVAPITYPDSTLTMSPVRAAALADQILKETSYTITDGLELSLWASDSLMADPIAISMDEAGGIYYTQGNRILNSEFDIRGHREWMTESISWEHVEDRRAFLRRTFTDDSEQSKAHLKDMNNDGVLNWKDLTVEKEDIWYITDQSNDGVADHARLYMSDFHEEITDLANGVEAHDGDVYVAVGPDLWKTTDTDGDGRANEKISLGHGFAVHIGFGAHGMSGVTMGPDGRVYWGIGDIGMNLTDQDGQQWKYPNRGVIVRCETDGSNFEVFSHGHRNTHEFVFDKYGNLISEDNDGDHSGERERLVYIINGSDSGWRINWQFGKYTDPDNNGYKVWMDEKLSIPHWDGQAAYILPPIQNYVNGPTGMVYNPGTALGPEWNDHFFIAEFRGTPAASPIHAFTLKPDGAGFALDDTKEVVKGLLPTGMDFGPDGALYFGDWINGWQAKGLGRIWKLDTPNADETRAEVKSTLQADYKTKDENALQALLGHEDMRIRRKAQFELASRGATGYKALTITAHNAAANQLARIHALWGMGQQARRDYTKGADFLPFLADGDQEIITQAVKMIGDMKYPGASRTLIELVGHQNPRIAMHTTEALGRIRDKAGHDAIVDMIRKNNGKDMWLRHAGMIALGRIGRSGDLVALKDDPSQAVRLAAVVALRRMESPGIAQFLNDKDELVVTEAARGINDDWSIQGALPPLADLLKDTKYKSEALIRRSINANLRMGGPDNLQTLLDYASRADAPSAMRAEALATVGTWAKPSPHDRVDGRYRGEIERPIEPVVAIVEPLLGSLLDSDDPDMLAALSKMSAKLKINSAGGKLFEFIQSSKSELVRKEALTALTQLDFDKKTEAIQIALADRSDVVRSIALSLVTSSDISETDAVRLFVPILENGSINEKQSIYGALSEIKNSEAVAVLKSAFDKLKNNTVEKEVRLDILEAINSHGDEGLTASLRTYNDALDANDLLAGYRETMFGGDARNGGNIFYSNEAAQCIRCHAVFEYGGNAGPGLSGVADRLTKEKLLESLIEPSAVLAQGYAVVSVEMNDGSIQAGSVVSENEILINIQDGEGNKVEIIKSNIKNRTDVPSSMPSAKHTLTKKEIRDVVAWLGTLKEKEG